MNTQHFLSNLWRWKCGLAERDINQDVMILENLEKTEWSIRFERLMRNRLIMGAFRYGKLHADNKKKYDRIASAQQRLALYEKDGNQEHLIDIANMMMLEFEEGTHPKRHFAAIDDGIHAEEKK